MEGRTSRANCFRCRAGHKLTPFKGELYPPKYSCSAAIGHAMAVHLHPAAAAAIRWFSALSGKGDGRKERKELFRWMYVHTLKKNPKKPPTAGDFLSVN